MKIKNKAMAAVGAALLILAPASGASASDRLPVQSLTSPKVCGESGRHDPEYRRECMTEGTAADAAWLWYSTPKGVKGRESRDEFDRRSLCKFAHESGGIRKVTREGYADVAYDSFIRNGYVLSWIGTFAAYECKVMGYRVK